VRDGRLAVYGANAAPMALLLTSLSDDIVLLTDGPSELDPEHAKLIAAAGIPVRTDSLARLEGERGRLARVVFADGSSDERASLFLQPVPGISPLAGELGCEVDRLGQLVIDEDGRTSVPGVFAAGDTTTAAKAVVLAAAAGARAAFTINGALARGLLPVVARPVAVS
jgi:thioredoxin reductase